MHGARLVLNEQSHRTSSRAACVIMLRPQLSDPSLQGVCVDYAGSMTHNIHHLQATSAKHYEEKDARLEYLSWRVWFMKRNHARVKREDAKTLAAEKVDLPEDDPVLDTEDASDEETPLIFDPTASQKAAGTTKPPLSESSKRPQPSKGVKPVATKSDRRTLDDEEVASPGDVSAFFDHRVDGLYIILISLHGLVRGQQMELGKDPDTGGQVRNILCQLMSGSIAVMKRHPLMLFALSAVSLAPPYSCTLKLLFCQCYIAVPPKVQHCTSTLSSSSAEARRHSTATAVYTSELH